MNKFSLADSEAEESVTLEQGEREKHRGKQT